MPVPLQRTSIMASVMDPRKPKHLIPLVLGNWINNILSLGLSIFLVTVNPSMTRLAFGAYGLALQVFMALIGIRNGLFLLFNYSRPNEEELENQLECASHLYLTSIFGFLVVFAPFYWEFLSWRACKYRMHPTFMFYFYAELLMVDVLFVPVLLYALTQNLDGIVIAKLITGFVAIFWALVRIFIKRCCPWCPKIKVSPEKGEAPDDPTPY